MKNEFREWAIKEEVMDSLFPYSQETAWEDLYGLDEVDYGYLEAVVYFYTR